MGEFFVYSFFVGMFFYLFPIFVYIDGYLDVAENKFWFSISLFRFFRVFGGYLQIKKEGLVFHLTKKKAILIPFKQMGATRKKFEITQGFQLWRFHQNVETGGANRLSGIMIAALLQSASGAVFSAMQTMHPFLSLKSGLILTEQNVLKITVQTAFVFNGLVISIATTKKTLEVILNWIREKRLTASWKKRRSSSQASST